MKLIKPILLLAVYYLVNYAIVLVEKSSYDQNVYLYL